MVVPIALKQYLEDHPRIRTLHLHLDNDEVGRAAAMRIWEGLDGKYKVLITASTVICQCLLFLKSS